MGPNKTKNISKVLGLPNSTVEYVLKSRCTQQSWKMATELESKEGKDDFAEEEKPLMTAQQGKNALQDLGARSEDLLNKNQPLPKSKVKEESVEKKETTHYPMHYVICHNRSIVVLLLWLWHVQKITDKYRRNQRALIQANASHFMIQQDNNPKHTAKATKELLRINRWNINGMTWSQSDWAILYNLTDR